MRKCPFEVRLYGSLYDIFLVIDVSVREPVPLWMRPTLFAVPAFYK